MIFLESSLHLDMKDAVVRHFAEGNRYWLESRYGYIRSGSLRVDVAVYKRGRYRVFECETRPNIKRLKEKASRRHRIRHRHTYALVVTEEWFHRLDLRPLRGSFDIVLGFNVEDDAFTLRRDLRFMGPLRDLVLDLWMPVYKDDTVQDSIREVSKRKNLLLFRVREILQCNACKLGLPNPWYFCPRDNCPDSSYPNEGP